jgi:arylformamidase
VSLVTCRLTAHQTTAAAPKKGPIVFLKYDQAELDAAYNQDVWAANAQQVIGRWAVNSTSARAHVGEPTHVTYGPTPIETLDIYRTRQRNAPIHLFIHGGAWRRGLARDSAFAAELFVREGAHFVVPDFAWVQDVGGSLLTMADQVRRAVVWVHRNASTFGGDPDRLYISGHSSGGHLAAVALTTDWTTFGLPPNPLKAGLCCSGMFDLKGPRLSSRREYVKFDGETEEALSPIRHLDQVRCPLVVVYGSLESPEFQRQSREFADALQQRRLPSRLVVGDGYNHFELIETLANPYGIVGRLALEQMKLASA